jgi:hypothetical protein
MVDTLCRRWKDYAEGKPLPVWATTAMSMDSIPFLKASLGLFSVLLHTSDENPRSSDQAMVALFYHTLLEDTILEPTACGSPMVVWRRWSPAGDSSFDDLQQGLRGALFSH